MPNSGYVAREAALTCRASVSFPLYPSFRTPFGENGSVWPFGEVLSSPFHGAFCQSIDPWTASPQWTDIPEITDIWTLPLYYRVAGSGKACPAYQPWTPSLPQ